MKRRDFAKSAAATGAGLLILPGSILAGKGPEKMQAIMAVE